MRGPGMCCPLLAGTGRRRVPERLGLPVQLSDQPAQALGHESLAKHDVGPSDKFGEHRGGGGMSVARAMGCEGGIVGIDLVVQNRCGSSLDR